MASGLTALEKRVKKFTGAHKRLTTKGLRPDIQGLRMVAVVVVILDHLIGWPSGGFVGVDVFFVLSGFLITGLLLREQERTGRISFIGFYKRRIRRIIPAAAVVLSVTVLAGFLFFNTVRAQQTVTEAVYALLFVANWRSAISGTDYFQASGPISPLQHFWSLAVEEQFYLVWPWLLLIIFVVAARRGMSFAASKKVVGAAMLLVVAASFAWAVWETEASPVVAYFSTFSRTWELGVGALLAVASGRLASIPKAARPVIAWVGLAGIGASLFLIDSESAFPGPWAALPVLATALVVAAGTGGPIRYLGPLTNRASGYVGDISYSLYLWHFPVIIFGTTLFGNSAGTLLVCVAIFTLGSIYTYHLVEDPIRKSNWLTGTPSRKRQPGQFLTTAYKVTALSFLTVLALGMSAAALARDTSVAPVAFPVAPVATTPDPGQPAAPPELAALQAELGAALGASEWPEAVVPALDAALQSQQAPSDVMKCGGVELDEMACTWGDPNATRTAITVGNSISMTYVESLRSAMGTDAGWNVMSYGMFGCPFGDSGAVPSNAAAGCADRLDAAVEAINRIQPDVVFVSGIAELQSAKAQMEKIKAAPRIVYLPGPPGDADISECYTQLSSPADCINRLGANWASKNESTANALGAEFINSSEWFCYQGACPSFAGPLVTKMDNRHMTPEYAARIAPAVREKLVGAGVLTMTNG